jgi:tripartite ATP-independent transporter DctM subunit
VKEKALPENSSKDTFIGKLSNALNMVAGFSMLGVATITVYEVIFRKIFSLPTGWIFTTSLFVMMWFALLAAPKVLKEGQNISVDFMLMVFSERTRSYLGIVSCICSLIFVSVLTYFGTAMCVNAYQKNMTSIDMLIYPLWILYLVFPICGSLMILQIIELTVSAFSSTRKTKKVGDEKQFVPWIAVTVFLLLIIGACLILKVSPVIALILLVLTLLFAGVPVSFALGLTGIIGMLIIFQKVNSLHMVPVILERTLHNFILLAIPLFIMGGVILFRCGVGERTYDLANKLVNNIPGGLAVGTILACALFSAMVGVSTAVAAAIGLTAIPMLKSHGYTKEMAYGSVAGGALGVLIPPSAGMIVYGFLTNASIGVLFAASFIPAFVVVSLFCIYAILHCGITGKYEKVSVTWKERWISLKRALLGLSAPAIMLGGIYTGIFTPTEAAGILVVYSLIVGIIYKKLSWRNLLKIIQESAIYGSVILMVMVGAMLFADVIAHLRIPRNIAEWIVSSGISPIAAKLGIIMLYLVLGMFLDGLSITVLTIPVLFPLMTSLDLNVIVFGVILMMFVEIALLTPPVGMNLFMIKAITGDSLAPIIKGNLPFAIMLLIGAIILLMFPGLALWLPELLGMM